MNRHFIFHLTYYKAYLSSLTSQSDKLLYIDISISIKIAGTEAKLPCYRFEFSAAGVVTYNAVRERAVRFSVKSNCLQNISNLATLSFQQLIQHIQKQEAQKEMITHLGASKLSKYFENQESKRYFKADNALVAWPNWTPVHGW